MKKLVIYIIWWYNEPEKCFGGMLESLIAVFNMFLT